MIIICIIKTTNLIKCLLQDEILQLIHLIFTTGEDSLLFEKYE